MAAKFKPGAIVSQVEQESTHTFRKRYGFGLGLSMNLKLRAGLHEPAFFHQQ